MAVFVDTSVWYAALNDSDVHRDATRALIAEALSFDDDYRVYRYGPEGRRAFRVLP